MPTPLTNRTGDHANIMGRPALANTDRSADWLAKLIKATEVVATSVEPCDPAIVTAFSHRLEMCADGWSNPPVRVSEHKSD
jgi:hypothetical protein